MHRPVAYLVGLLISVFAARAFADETAAASPAPTPAQPAPYPSAPPAPYSPPAYAYPPPPYGYPAYAPYDAGYLSPVYQAQKRSPGVSLALEFVLPGLGSIYGDHVAGAIVSCGLITAGLLLLLDGLEETLDRCDSNGGCTFKNNHTEIGLGVTLLMVGRLYGFVDAYTSTNAYNARLRQNLGLPPWVSLGIKPLRGKEHVAYAPTLQLRF